MNPKTPPPPPANIANDNAAQPKPPRTPAQIEASRINGSKSKGPTTAKGKHESSQNAIIHGLSATKHTILMTEDPTQYREVIDAFIEDLRPATKAELRLVEKIGNLDWRLERLVMMETCVLNMEVGVNLEEIAASFTNIDGIGFIVEAWKKSLSATHCLDLLRRYMGTLQHQFNTTLANFHKFENRRLAQKNSRELNPEFLPPYQRPDLGSLEPEPEEPEPELQNEPKKATPIATPIDIQVREQPKTPVQNQKPSRPAA